MKFQKFCLILLLMNLINLYSQYSYPTGVFCSCGPTTGNGTGSVAPNIAKLDFVKGILVRLSWQLCEPVDNKFEWKYLDEQIQNAKAYGKKISLAIGNGMGAPSWLYSSGVKYFVAEQPYNDTIPIPWDYTFLEKWKEFINVLGNRYKDDTTIVLVYATNSSGNGYEMQLPIKTKPSISESGYTDEKMYKSWEDCIQAFADAFPNHIITNDFHPVNGSNTVSDSVYSNAKTILGKRYGANAWWWTQKNTSVYPKQYEIIKNSASSKLFSGVQMAYSHTKDSAKFGNGGMPEALNLAINDGIYYWEIWNEDLLNTKFDSIFKTVTNLKPNFSTVDNCYIKPSNILIIPNPASSILKLQGVNGNIKILNSIGIMVWVGYYFDNKEINIEEFPSGIYFIIFNNKIYKFIKGSF